MTVINPSSISGITSITMPSGDGNVLTIHTNDGTERFRIDSSGNVKVGSACTISQDGDVFFTGVTTATTFTGAHSGSGANLTNLAATNLTGTIADARFPATLPAASAANLTSIPAANVTGTLPALTAANLTNIPAANIVGLATAGFERSGGFPQGITMRDCWRVTSGFTGSVNPLSSNLERDDSYSQGLIGSAMSVSSGYWTFPSTGYYLIEFHTMNYINGQSSRYVEDMIYVTTDNSSYNEAARGVSSIADSGSNVYCGTHTFYCFDVTDTSTHKVYFRHVPSNSSVTASGSSTTNFTYMTFTRLGDT